MASTMIHVNIDRSEPTSLHEQVAAEIRGPLPRGRLHREIASLS
jgi:hypothetical protein